MGYFEDLLLSTGLAGHETELLIALCVTVLLVVVCEWDISFTSNLL